MNLFTLKNFFLGMVAVFIGVVVYALLDWDRFYNRYLAKEEEMEQGYYYSTENGHCWDEAYLVGSERKVDTWYDLSGNSVLMVDSGSFRMKFSKLNPTRLFYILDNGQTSEGIEYSSSYQYNNDSSSSKSYGLVPDYYRNQNPPDQNLAPCN